MKRFTFICSGITLPILAISLISYGQASANGLRYSKEVSAVENSSSNGAVTASRRSDVNSRAAKDFARFFKDISNEEWFVLPDASIAKFTSKGVDYRVDYDKKGNWVYTIRTYDESEFPEDLRHAVKSTYYDYNILVVQEIEQPRGNFTYIVHLVGKSKLINLRIHDGDIEEWQKFTRTE